MFNGEITGIKFGEGRDSWEVITLPDGEWLKNTYLEGLGGKEIYRMGHVETKLVKEIKRLQLEVARYKLKAAALGNSQGNRFPSDPESSGNREEASNGPLGANDAGANCPDMSV